MNTWLKSVESCRKGSQDNPNDAGTRDVVDILWVQLAGIFGSSWERENGKPNGETAMLWRVAIAQNKISDEEVRRAVDYITQERPARKGDYARVPTNLSEFLSIVQNNRIPPDFPGSPQEVIREAVQFLGHWKGADWTSPWHYRVAMEVTPFAFREYSTERLMRLVRDAMEDLKGKLRRNEDLPDIENRLTSPARSKGTRNRTAKKASPKTVQSHVNKIRDMLGV